MAIQFHFSERSSMAFDRLAQTFLSTVKLHCALNLESRWVGRVAGDTNKNHPLFVGRNTVVDDLSTSESRVSVKDFLRRGGGVSNSPMVHCGICDQSDD